MRKNLFFGFSVFAVLGAMLFVGCGQTAMAIDVDNFHVSAAVIATCDVVADALSFGNYTQGGSNVNAAAQLHISCSSSGAAWTVDADAGQNAASGTRRMKHASLNQYLTYTLSASSTFTAPFGTGETGGGTVGNTGTQNVTIYGRIPGAQNPASGSYADTVLVTLTP